MGFKFLKFSDFFVKFHDKLWVFSKSLGNSLFPACKILELFLLILGWISYYIWRILMECPSIIKSPCLPLKVSNYGEYAQRGVPGGIVVYKSKTPCQSPSFTIGETIFRYLLVYYNVNILHYRQTTFHWRVVHL